MRVRSSPRRRGRQDHAAAGDGGGAVQRQRDAASAAVGIVDERGELAGMYRGVPQLDVGFHTDVLDGCPKALGIPMLVRSANPQVIVVDEITAEEDLRVMTAAANCGVALLATIHALDGEELRRKPLFPMLEAAPGVPASRHHLGGGGSTAVSGTKPVMARFVGGGLILLAAVYALWSAGGADSSGGRCCGPGRSAWVHGNGNSVAEDAAAAGVSDAGAAGKLRAVLRKKWPLCCKAI